MVNEIQEFEKKIDNITSSIIFDFKSRFDKSNIDIDYKGISRHGEEGEENYTSEIEIIFNNKGKIDYLDIYNQIIVLHNTKNFTLEDYRISIEKEFKKILLTPGGDWKYSNNFDNSPPNT